MGFLDIPYKDVPDLRVIPEGTEVLLTIKEAKFTVKEESGNKFIQLKLADMGDPSVKKVYENIFLPRDDDDEDKKQNKLRRIKQFCEAFQVDLNQCEVNDATKEIQALVGASGWVIVSVDTDSQYGESNNIARYIKRA